MAQKPTDGNTIAFNGNNSNSQGAAVAGTPGQSSSSQGQSVTFNHNASQSFNHNNLNTNGTPHHETGGIRPPLGEIIDSNGVTSSSQGQAVQGANGQAASAVGQSASSNQFSSTIVTNGQTAVVNQPGQTVTGESSAVIGSDGQSASSGTVTDIPSGPKGPLLDNEEPSGPKGPLLDNDFSESEQPSYNGPDNPDADTMYATGNTSTMEGTSAQGVDGQSASAAGQSATSTQSGSAIVTNGQTATIAQPGQTTTGDSVSVVGSDGQASSTGATAVTDYSGPKGPLLDNDSLTNTDEPSGPKGPLADNGGLSSPNQPAGGVTHFDTFEDLGITSPSDSTQATGGGLHMTNNPDGSHSITNGSMTMSEGADGTKTISNGSFTMTKGPDGTKTASGGFSDGKSDMEPRMATDSSVGGGSGGDFPVQSTYNHIGSTDADTLKAQIQSALPQPVGGWGSSDHVPPDPASGVLGIDKNKFTSPFDTKDIEKDD